MKPVEVEEAVVPYTPPSGSVAYATVKNNTGYNDISVSIRVDHNGRVVQICLDRIRVRESDKIPEHQKDS